MIGLIFLVSIPNLASSVRTLRVADGKTAHCKSDYDISRYKTGVYSARVLKVEGRQERILFTVKLNFHQCKNVNNRYQFVPAGPYQSSTHQIPVISLEDKHTQTLRITPLDVRLRGFRDGLYKLKVNQQLSRANQQTVVFSIPLTELLSQSECDQIAAGLTVKTDFDFWLHKKLRRENLDSGYELIDTVSYGRFRAYFNIAVDGERLKVMLLKYQ
jgi:hypothetical protein